LTGRARVMCPLKTRAHEHRLASSSSSSSLSTDLLFVFEPPVVRYDNGATGAAPPGVQLDSWSVL
jgi:hypothetical protein